MGQDDLAREGRVAIGVRLSIAVEGWESNRTLLFQPLGEHGAYTSVQERGIDDTEVDEEVWLRAVLGHPDAHAEAMIGLSFDLGDPARGKENALESELSIALYFEGDRVPPLFQRGAALNINETSREHDRSRGPFEKAAESSFRPRERLSGDCVILIPTIPKRAQRTTGEDDVISARLELDCHRCR